MSRPRHPDKHIEKAIRYAESLGWRVEMSRGHCWGHLLCPRNARDGCRVRVYSTPRDAEDHAHDIRREIDMCPHGSAGTGGGIVKHNFTLVLTGIEDITTEALDSLFDAGCDDGTLSSRSGRVCLTFTREAPSLEDAILSAIRDVRRAGLGVRRVDVCNLITSSEIARKIGRSRQRVHQYMNGDCGPGGFPPPACHLGSGKPLYLWCEVAAWLHENDIIKEEVLRDAQVLDVINGMLDAEYQKHLNPRLAGEVLGLVES